MVYFETYTWQRKICNLENQSKINVNGVIRSRGKIQTDFIKLICKIETIGTLCEIIQADKVTIITIKGVD